MGLMDNGMESIGIYHSRGEACLHNVQDLVWVAVGNLKRLIGAIN